MNNQRHYGLIDSLVITRNGNQLKSIEDYAEKHLTYTGASDFYDGYTYDTEYYYNANGALESDINRDIDLILYDALGNTRCIYYFGQNQIEYIYAADGTKLRTIHRPASSSALTDSIDYIGNLILKNGQPSMYLFEGGYATFDTNGTVDGWHYYIQDYMGNNRMVVKKNGTVEQITHYYPYGGVIGDISTNENVQKYKFEGKELDRTFGLDNYDIHARQYFAMMPTWDKVDPMAEFNFKGSPYAYCSGNPVNYGDYDGCDYWSTDIPDAIKQFLYEYNSGIGFCNYDFDGWQHTSDIDFINGLSYDDESNYYFLTLPFIDDDAFGVRCKIFSNKWIPSTESLMFSALEFSVGNRFKDLWNKQSASFKSPIAYDILHRFPYKVKTSPSIVYKMIIPNTIEKIGKSIGVIGAGIGAHHIYSNVSNNKSVGVGDALSLSLIIFGLCASSSVSLPVCGIYMISDLITYNLTSKTIDEHLNGKWNLDFPE